MNLGLFAGTEIRHSCHHSCHGIGWTDVQRLLALECYGRERDLWRI